MNFDETELCIVQALVLFTPDLSDLNDVTKAYLRKTCEKYTGILFEYCRTRFAKFLNDQMAESEAACRVAQIMLLIATMTKINLLCCDGMLCMDLLNICDWDGLTRQIYESQRHIGLEQAHVSRHPMLPTRLASFNDGTFQG
uniref:NR LBD domain-containing protein n=1 Tax=Plectus sambesii TaxID=2011161 RepID=A0A914W3V8_9BILA